MPKKRLMKAPCLSDRVRRRRRGIRWVEEGDEDDVDDEKTRSKSGGGAAVVERKS